MAVSGHGGVEVNLNIALCPTYAPVPGGAVIPIAPGAVCKGCGQIIVRPEDEIGVNVNCPLTLLNMAQREFDNRQMNWPPGAMIVP